MDLQNMSKDPQQLLPQIEQNLRKVVNIAAIAALVIVAFTATYIYMMYVRLDDKILLKEMKTHNCVSIVNGNIIITSREPESIFRISKRFARRHNLADIVIDGKVVNINDEKQMFYYVINNEELVVKSNYALQPSSSTMLLRFNDQELKLSLNLIYNLGSSSRSDLLSSWAINPHGNVELKTDVMFIKPPSNGKVTTLRYRKRFLNNVKLTGIMVANRTPVNLSIFIGQFSSVFIGLNDDRTIHVVQSKGKLNSASNDTTKRDHFKIAPNKEYRISLEKNNSNYKFVIEGDEGNKVIEFTEDNLCLSSTEQFKNVGFALWTGSAGVSVKDVMISSSDHF